MQARMHVPKLSYINKILIIAISSIFLLSSIVKLASGAYVNHLLSLSGGFFLKGHLYQIVTYPFVSSGIFEVVFDSLILWFIGSELEELWGRRRYISFLAVSAVAGGLIFLLVSSFFPAWISLSGPTAFTYPLLMAYSILFPYRTLFLLFFPIQARWFCLIIFAMQLYQGVFSPAGVGAWGSIGSMVAGYGFMLFVSRKQFKKRPSKRKKSHLRLVENDDDDEPPKIWQ